MTARVALAVLFASLPVADASAPCQVPVFRYALERWAPDLHEVFILTEGDLSESHNRLLEQLAPDPVTGTGIANIKLKVLDGSDDESQRLIGEWKAAHPKDKLPQVVVRSPDAGQQRPVIWSAPLSQASVDQFVNSPIRQQAAEELINGTSAVWLLLESGNEAEDKRAEETLRTRLRHLEKTLKLPTPDAQDIADGFDPARLKLKFVVLRVRRDDPEEQFLVESLVRVEPDLRDDEYKGQPLAFPVFGRGRALYALVGNGIEDSVIDDACQFLIGPCSCQVKEQNPGVDLLMAVDWEALVEESIDTDVELPPLRGLGSFGKPADPPAESSEKGVVVDRKDAAEEADTSSTTPTEAVAAAASASSEATSNDTPAKFAADISWILGGVAGIGVLGILALTVLIMKQQ